EHTGGLDPAHGYSRAETFLLPVGFQGRYHVFVVADADGVVFENELEANNADESDELLDAMPVPYADLVVREPIVVPATAGSGESIDVTWTVANQGIGATNLGRWTDTVELATDAAGTDRIATLGRFDHYGALAVGGEYERTGAVTLPDGLEGPHYVVVTTGGVFEFIHTDNNETISGAIAVTLSPSPDLEVTDIVAPTVAEEGSGIDVRWTVENTGLGEAGGAWTDKVFLREAGDPDAPQVELGTFTYVGPLAAGKWYTRMEHLRIPAHINDLYEVVVTTNHDGALYEHGPAADNNTQVDDETIAVSIKPRPDLEVGEIIAPDTVDAGAMLTVEFEVVNAGSVATTRPNWTDRVYLSLDETIGLEDVLIGEFGNQAALEPGWKYLSPQGSVLVPQRYRGDVYVLVALDADEEMDEWPNEDNNVKWKTVYVNPLPLADLVVDHPDVVGDEIVAPDQALAGEEIDVRFTVTNFGSGETNTDQWTDTLWLTADKDRPHPGSGDILLASIEHTGSLPRDAGYDVLLTVPLPATLAPGTYYVTPWSDPYGQVLEDTLAANINPDDPHEIDNNNYKARAIQILGEPPDLVVTQVAPDPTGVGGETFTVDWRVENQGTGPALPQRWVDRVYLCDGADPFAPDARALVLGDVTHDAPLARDATYDGSLTVTLSPSAAGTHVVVVTDYGRPDGAVTEIFEDNNQAAAGTDVVPAPADLMVTGFDPLPELFSGERAVLRYTVENVGGEPLWAGTEYWKDFVWISTDPTFTWNRSTYLGQVVHANEPPLAPGATRDAELEVTLPQGIGGDYYFYVHLDAHNDYDPMLFPHLARRLLTDWWPADTGSNAGWLNHFRRWGCEDPHNNLAQLPIEVTYNEPDLQPGDIDVPGGAQSGETIPVSFRVTNQGTRRTRQSVWRDRVFLSRDASLDSRDLYLGQFTRVGALDVGHGYDATVDVRLPDGIEGAFHVLVFTDSNAKTTDRWTSDIGFGLNGVKFEPQGQLGLQDWVAQSVRIMAQGDVPEFYDEGNNIDGRPLPVTLAPPPDLQVTDVDVPATAVRGQTLPLRYTVANRGGATPATQSTWQDLIYFSRDEFLDLDADRYAGFVDHEDGLGHDETYTVDVSVPVPPDLLGPYYVFVVTDPVRRTAVGDVFEADERNNDRAGDVPVNIELPPPTDLQVTVVAIPDTARSGEPVRIQWTTENTSDRGDDPQPAEGAWSDSVYLSADQTWDVHDPLIGRLEFEGPLDPGDSYTLTLDALLPPATPGDYRVLVRTDIFNQVYEDVAEANNTTASADTLGVTVDEIFLGVPHETTLSTGQQRLFQVTVPQDQTLRVSLTAETDEAANELFLRYDTAPTPAAYDAAYEGGLAASQTALIPGTEPGTYYILIHGHAEPAADTPVTLLAELLPLMITGVHTDFGGDSRYVTTRIEGASFHEDAIVKLVRPGLAEYEPEDYRVLDATDIIATFDLTGAPHGLYDLKVINPGGDQAVVPYRFQVERAIEPDVTIGVGGPRIILAGDTGIYSVALQSLSNLDTPYTFFQVGVPEMGRHFMLYDLPYLHFFSNVRGGPQAGDTTGLPWPALNSAVNTNGHVLAPGYMVNQYADDFTGFTFGVMTYPGLEEMHDRAWEELVAKIYAARPDLAETDALAAGPDALDLFHPGLGALYKTLGAIPPELFYPIIPFQFHLVASATAMNRAEFIDHNTDEADRLREAILADPDASPALVTLAADETTWQQLYLAGLEEAELLLPADDVPPIREHPPIVSLMATLASGIVAGPAGSEVITGGSLVGFFEKVREWYGHDPDQLADVDYIDKHGNPVPELPTFHEFDLGLSRPTHYEAFRVYVPWIPFEDRGAGLPPDFQIPGIPAAGEDEPAPLDFSGYFESEAGHRGLASITGPLTVDTGGFVPTGQPLPYTIHFQNAAGATTRPAEIRIVTELDDDLAARTFRLGDMRIGDIDIGVPDGRAVFQTQIDFSETKGFVLRVSAGVDVAAGQATWLFQAIDPTTGELLQDPAQGLLPPNDAQGNGAGFVGYTVEAADDTPTGAEIDASARVIFNTAPPEDTPTLTHVVDGVAPASELTVAAVSPGSDNFRVAWDASDDEAGSGVGHVTVYAATDGGEFAIWQRQVPGAAGSAVFEGEPGRTYEFLALATDVAGNQEQPPFGVTATDDGSAVNLGAPPTVDATTPPNFGIAPQPSPEPSTNPLFETAEEGIPAAEPASNPSEFDQVLRPFNARSFATGIPGSHADIGPMAVAEAPDGTILASGGPARSTLYRFDAEGGEAGPATRLAQLPHPVFNLAFDEAGGLWAVTGGGPLLELDPDTGAVLNEFGDGLTLALAVEPGTGRLYVASGRGVEIFDPADETFSHYSRDLDLRVGSLAFAPDGTLWAATWPDRAQVVRFTGLARAEVMLAFESADVDSIAFGRAGTDLEGLLFVSHNGGRLTMADVATLRRVELASGGSRGDVVATTADGRVLVSQSEQIDVFNPVSAPVVVATNPPADGVVALPLPVIAVTFD
ncbi:MAG: CARDB domain-containing protein, partial [Planctomycetota bacterium]